MTLQEVLQNPWVGFIGTLFGITGVALSIVFFLRSRRIQRPAYAKQSLQWFDVSDTPHSELRMFFRDQPIERFTITHLAFWNSGNITIRSADFAAASQLRIHIPAELMLFDIRVTAVTTSENGVLVIPPPALPARSDTDIAVTFDYFDPNDGFAVQLVHDGESAKDIAFHGKLPGATSIIKAASLANRTSLSTSYFLRRLLHGGDMPFSRTPWILRFLFLPLVCLGFGSIGLLSIYYMIWKEFHWYQPFGLIFLIYLIIAPLLMFERVPPVSLIDALQSSKQPKA